jgi:hypothetical protein
MINLLGGDGDTFVAHFSIVLRVYCKYLFAPFTGKKTFVYFQIELCAPRWGGNSLWSFPQESF